MISGKPFFSNHLKERESTRELIGSRTRTDARVWHWRHEPSASRTIKLQRRRRSQWEDGAPLPGEQAKIKNARRGAESAAVEEDCSERLNGKRKRKGKKTNIPHWFHDTYWFRRRQFNHGSVVAEVCPSRQRGEVSLRFSPGSESAAAAAMSQGRVTEGKRK